MVSLDRRQPVLAVEAPHRVQHPVDDGATDADAFGLHPANHRPRVFVRVVSGKRFSNLYDLKSTSRQLKRAMGEINYYLSAAPQSAS